MRRWWCSIVVALAWATSCQAATYYVRANGDDAANGRSHSAAWATLKKVNEFSFSPGDVVLLHEGDRFTGQITVDWPGTGSNRAVLGAYYLDGATPKRGIRTARPIIDGEDRLPSGHFDALVRVTAERVRVENLRVEDSNGRAIAVAADEAEVVGCGVYNTYNAGIHFLRSSASRAEDNFVTGAGFGHRLDDDAPWGASIEAVASKNTVIRKNIVSEVFGEGINAHSGSQYTLIEGNYVFAAYAVGIYSDGAPDTTIRRNIVVGTANSTYWRMASTVGAGIAVNNEKYHYAVGGGSQSESIQSQRTKVYGNLVSYTSSGIAVWGALPSSSFDGLLIYNNTLVDNDVQVTMSPMPKPGGKFINNILLSLSAGTRDVQGTNLGGMSARNNYFSEGRPGGDYEHAGNRFTGMRIAKTSGWRSVTARDQVNWRDFVLGSGSAAIRAGDDEPRRLADLQNDYNRDYNGLEYDAPMNMGALSYGTPLKPLSPRVNVSLPQPEPRGAQL